MENKVYVMVGISGSGKSTYIEKFKEQNPDVIVLSSDKLRGIIGKSEEDQSVTQIVFQTIKYNLGVGLRNNKDVMIDATSLNPKERRDYITIAKKHDAKVIAFVLERDKETIMNNQKKRKSEGGREVPEFVIDKMINKYVRPTKDEGFDEIYLL